MKKGKYLSSELNQIKIQLKEIIKNYEHFDEKENNYIEQM